MSKKKKKRIEPIASLLPKVLPAELEPEVIELYQLACKYSEPIWHKIKIEHGVPPPQEIINEFMRLTHSGMRQAQAKIVSKLIYNTTDDSINEARVFAYRGIANAIAWQLLKNELAYVKRFFMAQYPPTLKETNIESVIQAVEQCHQQYPDSIALISDLTTFIQIGDIYHAKVDGSISIYEVKEGETNRNILDILERTPTLVDSSAIPSLFSDKSESFQKQMQRTIRQKQRMTALGQTLANDEGIDALTGLQVKITELPIEVGTWYNSIIPLSQECESRGYALDVIQDCLFIGCYQTGKFAVPGQLAFEAWLQISGLTEGCPRTSLVNCMLDPLALPIYNLPLPDPLKFDLLFGRKHIAMAIHMKRLFEICIERGIKIRCADKKETATLKLTNKHLWQYNGQAIVIEINGQEGCLGEGYTLRVLYHGENPVDALMALAWSE